jgi:serine/threonine protein kinase
MKNPLFTAQFIALTLMQAAPESDMMRALPENLDVKPPAGYTIVRMLGRGGMGTVVQARQLETGRLVALKYLHLTAGDLRERFLREGRLASELVHPNVVQGLGIEFVDDSPVLVFEFVEGTDLRTHVVERKKLPVPEAVELTKQILAGLSCAHAKGIVHRDLKTANVMVTKEGTAKLADFGTAHLREAHEKLTRTGLVLGTPAYMAPEQAAGLAIDARADLYSVGVILFEMLSGRLPFAAPNPMALLLVVQKDAPPRVDELEPGVGKWIADVVDCCMAKKAEHRYPNAAALVAALDAQGKTTRSVKTQKNIPVLNPPPDMNATSAGDLPAAPAQDVSSPSRPRPRTSTGRVRTLSVSAVAVPSPPPGPPKWALGLGAVALLAIGALGARLAVPPRPPTPSASAGTSGLALAVYLAVLNQKDGAFLTRLDGRVAFSFRTDTHDPLTATLLAGGTEIPLRGLAKHTQGDVHAFEAPAERLIDSFHVRLKRADGRPVQAPLIPHPGLWSIVEEWHRKLAPIDTKPKPRDIWGVVLDRLARAVGVADAGDRFAAMAAGRGDPREERRHLEAVAKRAAAALQPLLIAAPAVLDLPLSQMSLAKKRLAYHALLSPRILDRLLHNAGLDQLMLGAERALGRRFATVDDANSKLPIVYSKEAVKLSVTSAGGLAQGGEDENMVAGFSSDSALGEKREIASHVADIKPPAPDPDQVARLDIVLRKFGGTKAALLADELLFVELPDQKWLLLLHEGSHAVEKDDNKHNRRAAHRLEPELLLSRTLFRFTREALRSPDESARRTGALWINHIYVRMGNESR